jgi:hypothetical protein
VAGWVNSREKMQYLTQRRKAADTKTQAVFRPADVLLVIDVFLLSLSFLGVSA